MRFVLGLKGTCSLIFKKSFKNAKECFFNSYNRKFFKILFVSASTKKYIKPRSGYDYNYGEQVGTLKERNDEQTKICYFGRTRERENILYYLRICHGVSWTHIWGGGLSRGGARILVRGENIKQNFIHEFLSRFVLQ